MAAYVPHVIEVEDLAGLGIDLGGRGTQRRDRILDQLSQGGTRSVRQGPHRGQWTLAKVPKVVEHLEGVLEALDSYVGGGWARVLLERRPQHGRGLGHLPFREGHERYEPSDQAADKDRAVKDIGRPVRAGSESHRQQVDAGQQRTHAGREGAEILKPIGSWPGPKEKEVA